MFGNFLWKIDKEDNSGELLVISTEKEETITIVPFGKALKPKKVL